MNKRVAIAAAAVVVVATVGIVVWQRRSGGEGGPRGPGGAGAVTSTKPGGPGQPHERGRWSRPPEPAAPSGLSAEEKASRVDKIKKDYDDIRTKATTDYTAAGANFPGGLSAFLKQLALLEREKRMDLAAVLSPQELEDLEMRESNAGQLVQRLLGATNATEEQRRRVFQLQREFEERFALTFDLTPRALLERETARQQVQEQIRAVLGDQLFASWLRGEGEEFRLMTEFTEKHSLPPATALELRRIKNEFTLQRLQLSAAKSMSDDQRRSAHAILVQQTEARVMNLVGQGALLSGRTDVLNWLPKR